MLYPRFKRLGDVIISVFLILIFFPLFLMLALLVKIDSKGPIIFKQKRVGRFKKHFNILKFRTMSVDSPKDTPTHLLENPERWTTKFGIFLRKSGLDEIPQLINILRGDMSIVGPRPALWNQFDLINERDIYFLNDAFPGLTGYAQINGREELTIYEKVKFDTFYVRNMNLWLDIKIIIRTFFCIFQINKKSKNFK